MQEAELMIGKRIELLDDFLYTREVVCDEDKNPL